MDPRIERLQRRAAASPGVLSFGGGLPSDTLFPRGPLSRAFVRAVQTQALQYGWPEGSEALRRWVSGRLRARGAEVDPADVIVTSGAQQAIAIAARLQCRPGERVLVDSESYPGALDLFRSRGLRPSAHGGAARYVMPAVQNPHGRALDEKERTRLERSRSPILEDDAYAELRFDGRLLPPLLASARDRVWHIGTFSKTLCPGLRVGWLVPPRRFLKRALRHKRDDDLQAGGLAQAVLESYLAETDWDARLWRLRRIYARRAARLTEALRRRLPSWRFADPEGGFSVWVELDDEGDDAKLLEVALAHGVSFDPGRSFRADAAPSPLALRLCFSAIDEALIDEGVRRLERAFEAFRAKLFAHDSGRARVGRGRIAARLRPLRPRPRRRAAAVDPLVAPVGHAAARRRRRARVSR